MRLSIEKINCLTSTIVAILPDARVFLFGSRVDDRQKGGDIDILIIADKQLDFKQISQIKKQFFAKFGAQKIDLVSFTNSSNNPFKQVVLKNAIRL